MNWLILHTEGLDNDFALISMRTSYKCDMLMGPNLITLLLLVICDLL